MWEPRWTRTSSGRAGGRPFGSLTPSKAFVVAAIGGVHGGESARRLFPPCLTHRSLYLIPLDSTAARPCRRRAPGPDARCDRRGPSGRGSRPNTDTAMQSEPPPGGRACRGRIKLVRITVKPGRSARGSRSYTERGTRDRGAHRGRLPSADISSSASSGARLGRPDQPAGRVGRWRRPTTLKQIIKIVGEWRRSGSAELGVAQSGSHLPDLNANRRACWDVARRSVQAPHHRACRRISQRDAIVLSISVGVRSSLSQTRRGDKISAHLGLTEAGMGARVVASISGFHASSRRIGGTIRVSLTWPRRRRGRSDHSRSCNRSTFALRPR